MIDINDYTCPLNKSEKERVSFVDFVDHWVRIDKTKVDAIFVGGKILIKEEDYKKLFS